MRRTKTISAAEQVALCRRAQAGDLAARNALVTATMGLVYREAHRWVRSANGLELDDLAAEGVFGLVRAIEKFDCDRGLAFITYASHWVKHFIRQAHGDDSGVRRSDTRRSALARDVRALVARGETRERAIEVVAVSRGVRPSTIRGVVEAHERKRPQSLDVPIGDEDGGSLLSVMAGESVDTGESIDAERRATAVRVVVSRLLSRLPARERAIVLRRFACDDEDAATLAELGDEFSVSRERIRQIEVELRSALRSEIEAALSEPPGPRGSRPGRARTPTTPVVSRAARLSPVRATTVATRSGPAVATAVVAAPATPSEPRPIAVVVPVAPLGRRPCRLCGRLLRRHNRHGVCSAHGHSETFDRATGRCSVCGEVVTDPSRRGGHALLHRAPAMSADEQRVKQRQRHKALRAERRARGECEGCGGAPAPADRLCASCRRGERRRGLALRRREGRAEKRPVLLTHGGETLSLGDWSRRTGISVKNLWQRLFVFQWAPERVLEPLVPSNTRRKQKPVCVNGHARTPESLWVDRRGTQHCRECGRQRCRARRARAMESAGRLPLSRAS